MDQPVEMTAAGRKGEEADLVDVTTMLEGDHITILVSDEPGGEMRLTKLASNEWRLEVGKSHRDAAPGEIEGSVGAVTGVGGHMAAIRFRAKRDPKADLKRTADGEFTA